MAVPVLAMKSAAGALFSKILFVSNVEKRREQLDSLRNF